jgi:hypothetical protein
MIFQIDRKNTDTTLILENNETTTLGEIFPKRWQELWEE